jgi:histidine phosphotransferase ChpT
VQEGIAEIFAGKETKAIDNKLVVAYFAARLAADARCKIAAVKEGEDVLFTLESR